jgi:hypothetical protein
MLGDQRRTRASSWTERATTFTPPNDLAQLVTLSTSQKAPTTLTLPGKLSVTAAAAPPRVALCDPLREPGPARGPVPAPPQQSPSARPRSCRAPADRPACPRSPSHCSAGRPGPSPAYRLRSPLGEPHTYHPYVSNPPAMKPPPASRGRGAAPWRSEQRGSSPAGDADGCPAAPVRNAVAAASASMGLCEAG